MKNPSFERRRRQALQYHRNRRGDQFEGGILVRHVYDDREPERLSWWDDVEFIRGKMRVHVAWQHPRCVYQDLIEEAAMAAAHPLYEQIDGDLFDGAVKLHKRIGWSRKKVSGYRATADRPGEREWFDAFRAEQERLSREAEFSVRTSFDVQQLNWCRFMEIEAPRWLYSEVVDGKRPGVLTVHPDYFLIEPGVGRFVYRLARRAAGKNAATWAFQTIYERSGSAGTFKEFCRLLRKIIQADDLPEYELREEAGQGGPLLVMAYRDRSSADLSPPCGG